MTEGDTPPPRAGRRWYVWASLAALVVVVAVVLVAALRPRAQDDYDDAVRARFLSACTAQGGEPVRETCTCFYDQMVGNVPFDRFELLDETLAIQTQSTTEGPLELPDDIQSLLDECVNAGS